MLARRLVIFSPITPDLVQHVRDLAGRTGRPECLCGPFGYTNTKPRSSVFHGSPIPVLGFVLGTSTLLLTVSLSDTTLQSNGRYRPVRAGSKEAPRWRKPEIQVTSRKNRGDGAAASSRGLGEHLHNSGRCSIESGPLHLADGVLPYRQTDLETLLDSFLTVKAEFSDLDGLSWHRATLPSSTSTPSFASSYRCSFGPRRRSLSAAERVERGRRAMLEAWVSHSRVPLRVITRIRRIFPGEDTSRGNTFFSLRQIH